MGLTTNPKHIFEPNPLACGQAVLAMLTDLSAEEVIAQVGTDRETTLSDMEKFLSRHGIPLQRQKQVANTAADLPDVCLLSLETPKCWHWALYFEGVFFDPEYGILQDFPECKRKYYFKIR